MRDDRIAIRVLLVEDGEGFDTLASADAIARHLPVVVRTGVDDDQMALRAIRAGAQDYRIEPLTDVRPVARALLDACERRRRPIFAFERAQERVA